MPANCDIIAISFIYRQVPILNLSTFFSEVGVDHFSWENTLSKSWNTHFPKLNNKRWRHYDVIIVRKSFSARKNWINAAITPNN